MKKRKWLNLLLVGGLLAALLFNFGCVELTRFVQKRTERLASLVPGDTALYLSLNLTLEQAVNFERLWQVFATMPGAEEAFASLLEEVPTGEEISFEKDIAPWLGLEGALAIPFFKEGADLAELGPEQPVIIALTSRDTAQSEAFLRKITLELKKEGEVQKKYHKGTTLFHYKPEFTGETPLVYAAYEDFILFSNDLKFMRQVIDIARGEGQSLAENEDYQALLKALPAERVGHIYLASGRLLEELAALSKEVPELLPKGASSATRGLAVSLGFIPAGVVIDYVTSYDVEKLPYFMHKMMRQKPNPHRALRFAPAETIFYLSGQDLSLLWDYGVESWGQGADFQEGLQDIEEELGLNLRKDVFSWMRGEYALALLPDPGGFMGEKDVPLGLLILVEVKDKKLVQGKMKKIAVALAEQLMAQPKEEEIEGLKMHMLSSPFLGINLGYGFIKDFLVIGTSEQMLRQAVKAQAQPLEGVKELHVALSPLPTPSTGYFYLNIQKVIELITKTMSPSERRDFQREVLPYVQPLKALSSANVIMEEGQIIHGRLLLLIEK